MNFWKITTLIFVAAYLALVVNPFKSKAAPHIANYFLGVLPSDPESVKKLAKTDLLIVSPDRLISQASLISQLKSANPKMIILAYVPSQSYNTIYWKNDLVFRNLNIKDEWWMRDSNGNFVSDWPGLQNLDMDHEWSEYLVSFINQYISTLPNVDGVFFDIVNEGVSHVNKGDIVLTDMKMDKRSTDLEWIDRMKYLLSYARENLKMKYIVINGSSHDSFQSHVNGRMYETFPTPWEYGGSWSGIMTRLQKNQSMNLKPEIYVFNSNSNNTGKQDFKKMRFGISSSLLTDNVYFSYDHGDENHGQVWWFDEYDVNLGTPSGPAQALGGAQPFKEDVWRRDFANGITLVNPTNSDKKIDLGGEYEKLIGTQDKKINNGQIVDSVKLSAKDGLLLYKTFQSLNDVYFENGNFLRFYGQDGERARNGFFAYEKELLGGSKVYMGDLNGDGLKDKLVVSGNRLQIYNEQNVLWYDDYPFGVDYKGTFNVAVRGVSDNQIVLAGSIGGRVALINYFGQLTADLYPLQKKYRSGFSVAATISGDLALGAGNEVVIFDTTKNKIKNRFYPYGKNYKGSVVVAAGDFNGDKQDEIAVAGVVNGKHIINTFNQKGSKLKSFEVKGVSGKQKISIGAADVTGEGKEEIVVISKN